KYLYPISDNIQIAASQYYCLMLEMQDNIELLARSNIHTEAIINVLTYK
ncbi:25018_t:CDS:1, partial [Racocetra persica]